MALMLGPMPANVRLVVRRLVEEAQRGPREVEDRPNGFPLTGGPGGCSYLDADGEVWDFDFSDPSVPPSIHPVSGYGRSPQGGRDRHCRQAGSRACGMVAATPGNGIGL
jgi:hypothetical protein